MNELIMRLLVLRAGYKEDVENINPIDYDLLEELLNENNGSAVCKHCFNTNLNMKLIIESEWSGSIFSGSKVTVKGVENSRKTTVSISCPVCGNTLDKEDILFSPRCTLTRNFVPPEHFYVDEKLRPFHPASLTRSALEKLTRINLKEYYELL